MAPTSKEPPFWKTKTLTEMSQSEWESLCDGCGKCCLNKLEDEDTGKIYYTDVACKLLDRKSCRCTDYPNRFDYVPDCIKLSPKNVSEMTCLPKSCAYRLLSEGKSLFWWHPLVSGDPNTVHEAGISARDRTQCESTVPEDQFEDHIVKWPNRMRAQKRKAKSS